MSVKTEMRLRVWLGDDANIRARHPASFRTYGNEFDHIILRNKFVTRNGISVSIQQGASHYCDAGSVEMWCCPHHPILDAYGTGEDPYARVPLSVVAQYIDAIEGEANEIL